MCRCNVRFYCSRRIQDGTKEEGKYKNNVLITSQKKKHLFLIRSAKFRERIEAAVSAAQRASKIALQKADIAISRTSTARAKAEQADLAAIHAREDADFAIAIAKQLAPDFTPSEYRAPLSQPPGHLVARRGRHYRWGPRSRASVATRVDSVSCLSFRGIQWPSPFFLCSAGNPFDISRLLLSVQLPNFFRIEA